MRYISMLGLAWAALVMAIWITMPLATMPPDRIFGVPWGVRQFYNVLHPGYAKCGRCADSFGWKRGHTLWWRKDLGTFSICEQCWRELGTPAARFPYYAADAARRLESEAVKQAMWVALQQEAQ